ncbi:MAG: DUF4956 domain-containing protein [Bacilli bacterium]|nr:DUF4956 domain-containing protein [Bacilli bacterium]
MSSLFSLLPSVDKIYVSLMIVGITFIISFLFSFLISLKMKGTKSFFVTSVIMPVIVSAVISMVSIFLDNTSTGAVRIATIAVALGLVRFRSVNARAEELLVLFAGIAIGLISGLGYVVFALIFAVIVAALYLGLTHFKVFDNKRFNNEKMLKITIPEALEYSDVFNDTFVRYLKHSELIEVKTTAMGSLFKLSYHIELKVREEEKQFIDELRTKNGNLEISIVPYVGEDKSL